jgi:electron transfer flavoprotein beta subunit
LVAALSLNWDFGFDPMHIIVCLKQIVYTYARTGMDPGLNFLSPEDKITRVNPQDETALELALRIKDSQEGCRVTLLTLGPLIAENELRRCLAQGADRLCRIDREGELDSWAKARVMAWFIREMKADLILCGKESLDRQNGQVGALLASCLGLPFVTAVSGVSLSPENTGIKVTRSAGRGIREVIACPLPALVTVEGGAVEPRLPTHLEKIGAQSQGIENLSYPGEAPPARLIQEKVFPPRPRPRRNPAPDSRLSATERIRLLLIGSRTDKQGQLLTGSTESQVEGIISFMKTHELLGPKTKAKDNP